MSSSQQNPRKNRAELRANEQKWKRAVNETRAANAFLPIQDTASCPVAVSQIGDGAYSPGGTCTAIFGRRLPNQKISVASFLIDLGCLGIKKVVHFDLTQEEYRRFLHQTVGGQSMVTVQPSTVRCLVQKAADYAQRFGFQPARGFLETMPIFGDVPINEHLESFPFGGEDGNPVYVRTPLDSDQYAQRVIDQLRTSVGDGNFNVVQSMNTATLDFDPQAGTNRLAAVDAVPDPNRQDFGKHA